MYLTRRLTLTLGFLFTACAFSQSPPGTAVPLDQVQLDESRLRVHFIDIGPGLAMLIETPSGLNVFIDGGKWGLDGLEEYVQHFVPTSESMDVVIVTHADLDHFAGASRIFAAYKVGEFWYTGYSSPELNSKVKWNNFLSTVADEEDCTQYVPLSDWVSVGDVETLDDLGTPNDDTDDIVIHYLNVDSDPPAVDPISGRNFKESQRRNNASLVIKIVYRNVSFLITGDINGRDKDHIGPSTDNEIDSEELELWTRHQLASKFSLKSTVLQLPHHGSNGSCSLRFIQAVDPDWVVIPAGHEHNHPHPESLRRLSLAEISASHILRTDEGDSTPEKRSQKDPRGDDSFVFETDGQSINRILRVTVN